MGVGINVEEKARGEVMIGSFKPKTGDLWAFVPDGKITDDVIEKVFSVVGWFFEKRRHRRNTALYSKTGLSAPCGDNARGLV